MHTYFPLNFMQQINNNNESLKYLKEQIYYIYNSMYILALNLQKREKMIGDIINQRKNQKISIQQTYIQNIVLFSSKSKMKKDIIMPLNTVNHYTRLPDGQSVKLFQKFITETSHRTDIPIKQYFLAAHSLKDAFLIACFCFGQLKFLDALSSLSISTETIDYLRTQMSQFCWNKISPLSTFQENSKKFGKIYPYYWQNVQKKLKNQDCQELFKRVKDNHLLFGVKIRRWKELEEPKENYRNLQRLYEETELMRVDGTRYLLFAQTNSGSCNFGVLQQTFQIDSRLNYPDPIQAIQNICPIEQIAKKQQTINLNTFDVNKKQTEDYQFRKYKQFQLYNQPKLNQIKIYNQKKEPMESKFSQQIKQSGLVSEISQTKQFKEQKKFQQVGKFHELPQTKQGEQRYWGLNSLSGNKYKQNQQDHQYKLRSQSTAQQKSSADNKIYQQNKSNTQVYTPWGKNISNIITEKKAVPKPNYQINSTSPEFNNKNKPGLSEKKFPSKYQSYDQNKQQVDHAHHKANPQESSSKFNQQQNIVAQNNQINSNCCNYCSIM